MRLFFLVLSWMLTETAAAQVNNPAFDDWEVIQIGQPYENPIGWTTNNMTNKFGLASTPVDKGVNENGFYARVSSNSHGIDATGSGKLSQMIALDDLVKIEFDAQCDSLFQTGRCVVSIFNQNGNTVYVDIISTMADSFRRYVLPVDPEWAATNDSIRLQFTADGGFDPTDTLEDGYSIFLIDNASAEYITASKEIEPVKNFSFYPNPTSGWIQLTSRQNEKTTGIEIATIQGQIIFRGPFVDRLDLESLTTGVYILTLRCNAYHYSSLVFKQ